MRRRVAGFFASLLLCAGACFGQTPRHYVEIKLPSEVPSQTFFVRYVLAGQDFGGWVDPRSGVSSYVIGTMLGGRPATGIKAILYAPGCAIRTLDLRLSGSDNPQYSFVCHPIPSISIAGTLVKDERLLKSSVQLQAKYAARWAHSFLGLSDVILTTIPIGDASNVTADGRFRIVIPDLSQDPLAAAPDHPGEIQIWAKDQTAESILAQLTVKVPQSLKTRMGGLKVRNEYPAEIVFAPCGVDGSSYFHDRMGFAIREEPNNFCDR
jgi:hypothetical protein